MFNPFEPQVHLDLAGVDWARSKRVVNTKSSNGLRLDKLTLNTSMTRDSCKRVNFILLL